MKTAGYLVIMIAIAVIMKTVHVDGWYSGSLMIAASLIATIKALSSIGD